MFNVYAKYIVFSSSIDTYLVWVIRNAIPTIAIHNDQFKEKDFLSEYFNVSEHWLKVHQTNTMIRNDNIFIGYTSIIPRDVLRSPKEGEFVEVNNTPFNNMDKFLIRKAALYL